jgi:hypothetical protein
LRETFSRDRRIKLRAFAFVCNILCNSVARRLFLIALLLGLNNSASAQSVAIDETCTTVRQVFVGLNNIGRKGNTKIVPFSDGYMRSLTAYFERGCPRGENFPMPKPGTDMQLAVTAGDAIVSGKIKFDLGKPLLR